MTNAVINFRMLGDAILRRTGQTKPVEKDAVQVPAELMPFLDAFVGTHVAYSGACDAADNGREQRDTALEAVGLADDALDATVLHLANMLVGAGLGDRRNPFAEFAKLTPANLCRQSYANEPGLVRELVKKVLAKQPPAEVTKAANACAKQADAVDAKLAGLTMPQALFTGAMKTRDDLLPEWHKALRTLKVHAAAAWLEAPGTLAMVFAPPPVVAVPRRRKARVKKATEPVVP